MNNAYLPKCSLVFVMLLTSFLILPEVNAQSEWVQLFYDDFEDGNSDGWQFELYMDNSKWEVIDNENNYVLNGESHNWASLEDLPMWSDFAFSCKVLILDGGLHLNYRVTSQGRYLISFNPGGLALKKNSETEEYDLAQNDDPVEMEQWHEIEIIGIAGSIRIYVNDELKIDFTDSTPIEYGSIAFEVNPDSRILIDDVEVRGEQAPEPPDSYVWEKTGGPNGGLGYDIRIHPSDKNIMFVTDNPSGVNKSYDGGESWAQKNEGIDSDPDRFGNGAPIFSLTIDPGNPSIIWAGTQAQKGIYKSIDSGETWEEKVNGIVEGNEISFRGFAIHPNNSDIVFAAADIIQETTVGNGILPVKGKIYRSIDGGENWVPVWEGENCARVLIFDYENPDTLYCSTGIFDQTANNIDFENVDPGGEGILKSIDGGDSWFRINNGIDNLYLGFLEMHPTNPKILYAAAGAAIREEPFNCFGGIYKTVDGGENWVKVLEEGGSFTVVTISKSNPEIIYAGDGSYFFRSNNGGDTWVRQDEDPSVNWGPKGIWGGVPISAVVDPDDPDVIFVNSYQGGNYKSIDGAKTWINASKGYSGAVIRDVTIDPNRPGKIYAVGTSGPFISLDGGGNWDGLKYDAAEGASIWTCIAINPKNPNELLMSDPGSGYILKSENYGLNWDFAFIHPISGDQSGENNHGFKQITYSITDPNIIYAGMRKTGSTNSIEPDLEPSFGIYKSLDGGETWEEKNNGLDVAGSKQAINDIAVHPGNPDIAYAATLFDGIFKTVDGGENWTRQSNGLGFADVRSLAIDPMNPNTIYAGSGDGNGIWKTTDGGDLWFEVNNSITVNCPSYLSPIGNTPVGFSVEKPESYSYEKDMFNFLDWTKILDIVIDPTDPQKIYVADLDQGIFFSIDGGASWWQMNEGLSVKSVNCLTISSDGKIMYAGTEGAGVHRIVLCENKAPSIIATIPNISDTVSIAHGDSIWFEAAVFDFDHDTLSYKWYLDNVLIEYENLPHLLLETQDLDVKLYSLRADISDNDTTSSVEWIVDVIETTVNIDADRMLPTSFSLLQNYPNPFNLSTTIAYRLSCDAYVKLKIFNLLGQEIKSLVSEPQIAGFYKLEWDGTDNAHSKVVSGIYIYRVEYKHNNTSFIQERKMMLLE